MMADTRKDFPDRPWTIKEVADYLQVSVRTIHNRMNDSEFPHRYVGRDLRFIRDEVDAWVHEQPGQAA